LVRLMDSWFETVRISVTFLFLAYSSWKDYQEREVSDTVWLLLAPIGLFFSLLQAFLRTDISFLISLAVSSMVMTGLSFALFYLDFFGGADAKALICLSIALPTYPTVMNPSLDIVLPIFPLSVVSNAVFASCMLVFVIMFLNISRYIKTGTRFFQGLEGESAVRRFFLFVTGVKVDLRKVKGNPHYIPLEIFSQGSDGKINRHLHLFPRVNKEETQNLNLRQDFSKDIEDGVWVTPSIPFLVFVSLGFVAALFLGDILIWLVFSLLK